MRMSGGEKQQPRVVSKAEYIKYLATQVRLQSTGVFLLCGAMCSVIAVIVVPAVACSEGGGIGLLGLLLAVACGFAAIMCFKAGTKQCEKADSIEPVVPLTRRTAAQLPEPQSLVRASE